MSTSWNGQICNSGGKYYIQFETDNKELYKLVESACQVAMDIDRNPEIIDMFNEVPNNYIPEPCRNCSNHPSNGGSGFCNCALGQPSITSNTLSTNPLRGYYAAPFTISEEGKQSNKSDKFNYTIDYLKQGKLPPLNINSEDTEGLYIHKYGWT